MANIDDNNAYSDMEKTKVPDITSAEMLANYPPGQKTFEGIGNAWTDVRLSVFSLSSQAEAFEMPSVAEPFIAWVVSGEGETRERDVGGIWRSHPIQPGTLFLTKGGAPYSFQWKRTSEAPIEIVLVLLSTQIFDIAAQEIYGEKALTAVFRNVSGVQDDRLVALMNCLKCELDEPLPCPLFTKSMAQAISVHLVRHYVDVGEAHHNDSKLPSYKLRLITTWMNEHLDAPFRLATLAKMADISESHFNRLFKNAVGMPPSQYQIKLRMTEARRLLRETKNSVVEISNIVGYSNPSHFAQLFKKENGVSPSEYRQQ